MQTTTSIKKKDQQTNWVIVDAKGKNLGRCAVKVAKLLIGKEKKTYSANLFSGDNVIVINTSGIQVGEKKVTGKLYHRHSGYPGGLKTLSFEQLMAKNPTTVLRIAVKGMLPKTKMGREMLSHMYLYRDEKHPHEAQTPTVLS